VTDVALSTDVALHYRLNFQGIARLPLFPWRGWSQGGSSPSSAALLANVLIPNDFPELVRPGTVYALCQQGKWIPWLAFGRLHVKPPYTEGKKELSRCDANTVILS